MVPSGSYFAVRYVIKLILPVCETRQVFDEGNWHTNNDEKKFAMAVACLEPLISEVIK